MTEATQEFASRWKRLAAALLDACVGIVVTFPVMMALGVFQQIREGQQMSVGQQVFFFFFGLVMLLAVHGYFLATYGQTVGKRLIGTRIVSYADGQILPLAKVFDLRYLPLSIVAQIPIIGGVFAVVDILFILGQEKRCVHDLVAGTKVVNA